ncbi:MAG: type II secretion system protein [Rhodocyclaceae bacterium]|nr:type II secretion system protein [Rhodocyclaceae bacterium]
MHQMKNARAVQHGFTLAELAVVLTILTILAGALVIPFRGQLELRQRQQTEALLADAQAALIGFAAVHGRLPCPTTQTNPADAGYGQESIDALTGNCVVTSEGMLPWRTLGLAAFDAWGQPRSAPADPWTGHFRYRVDSGFARLSPRIAPDTAYGDEIKVVDHAANAITVSTYSGAEALKNTVAVALVYSTGPDLAANGANASYESAADATYEQGEPTQTFDDIVTWIGRPLLIARMAEAGGV